MAKVRSDEVLGKALATDQSVIPRFTIKKPDGTVVVENATVELTNPVVKEGMPVDKTAMDECLSASGRASGTKKALTLEQENFALFDGALVRVQLFDQLSGASTLNVNGTGAKRIKTSSGEDPDGLTANVWVDLIYSAARDQYILLGNGGGSAALSNSINLLEEVVDMKYCSVLTRETYNDNVHSVWCNAAAVFGVCDTADYRVYARIMPNSKTIEVRYTNKSTGEISKEYYVALNSSDPPFPTRTPSSSYSVQEYAAKLQLIAVRGEGNHIIWAYGAFQYYGNGRYATSYGLGLLFDEGTSYLYKCMSSESSNYSGDYTTTLATFGMLNAYCAGDYVYAAFPNSYYDNQGDACTCCNLICIQISATKSVWSYTDAPSSGNGHYNNASYGRDFWVLDDTTAIAFTSNSYDGRNSYCSASRPLGFKVTFTSAAAPSTGTNLGSSAGYRCYYANYSAYTYVRGWVVTPEYIGCIFGGNYVGTNGSVFGLGFIKYNISSAEMTYEYKQLFSSHDGLYRYVATLPGYTSIPGIFIGGAQFYGNNSSNTTEEVAQLFYNFDTGKVCRLPFVSSYTRMIEVKYVADANAVADWTSMSLSRSSGQCTGASYIGIDKTGKLFEQDIEKSMDEAPIVWECPEDGTYKLIAVGGGACGTASYGGGAGYLKLATVQLSTGDVLKLNIGMGGMVLRDADIAALLRANALATATAVYVNDEKSPRMFALPATGNSGGATGAATPSGGGAGGYDLVQYGGQGMNYIAPSVTSATGTTINPVPLSKDRNGGVSANTGAVTSGDGYGAGGGMNQNGKDGCVVIIR